MLFKKVISEFGAKTFDSCEQKISHFQMKDKFESLLGISIEKAGCLDHMTFSQMPTYFLIVIITYTRGLPPPGPPADSLNSKFWSFALNQRDLH
jgi:hypothetical protein